MGFVVGLAIDMSDREAAPVVCEDRVVPEGELEGAGEGASFHIMVTGPWDVGAGGVSGLKGERKEGGGERKTYIVQRRRPRRGRKREV